MNPSPSDHSRPTPSNDAAKEEYTPIDENPSGYPSAHEASSSANVTAREMLKNGNTDASADSLRKVNTIKDRSLPLVSIIIPCYNTEKYIAESIQSALNQTYPNCEVIVIDDGSTDASLEMIKSFGDLIKWETGPNRGGCAARNRGLEISEGDRIQFHDADDILISSCVADKINTPSLENEIICSDCALISQPDIHQWGGTTQGYPLEYALRRAAPPTAGPLHCRWMLLEINGFREGLPCAQDYDLAMRLMTQLNVTFIRNHKIGALVRPLPNSVFHSSGLKLPTAKMTILDQSIEEIQKTRPLSYNERIAVSGHYAGIARQFWIFGSYQDALSAINKSKSYSQFGYLGAYKNIVSRVLVMVVGFRLYERFHKLFKSCCLPIFNRSRRKILQH